MALINPVNRQAPNSSLNTPVFRPVRINEGRPESKLCEVILRHLALEVFERPLKDRENAIQGYHLSCDLEIMLKGMVETLTTLENKLSEARTHVKLLVVLQEIRDLCSIKEAEKKELTYLPERFKAYFKPIIEKVAAMRGEMILFTKFQSQDSSLKEILGLWYVCNIKNETELFSALQTETYISKIRFEYKIEAADARILAEALKVNRSLTKLDLWRNQIGVAGAIVIANALKENTSLTRLQLVGNHIGAEGTRALAEALKVNRSLTSLDLGSNQIGVAGARVLAEALKVNRSLTSLALGGNQIGAEGARALAEALKVNTTLTMLDLRDNQIRLEGELTLRVIKASRPGLRIEFY